MSHQELRDLLILDLGFLAVVVIGIAIWTGRWRSWASIDYENLRGILIAPWFALIVVVMRVALFLKLSLAIYPPITEMAILIAGCVVLALSSAWCHWPMWALPPWYREFLRQKRQSEKVVGGGAAR